jgi:hypothetical protein
MEKQEPQKLNCPDCQSALEVMPVENGIVWWLFGNAESVSILWVSRFLLPRKKESVDME